MIKQLKTITGKIKCNVNHAFNGSLIILHMGMMQNLNTVRYHRFYRGDFTFKKDFYGSGENLNVVMKPMELMLKMCKSASNQTLGFIDRYSFLVNIEYHINRLKSTDYASYKIVNSYFNKIKNIAYDTDKVSEYTNYSNYLEDKLSKFKCEFESFINITSNIYNLNKITVNHAVSNNISYFKDNYRKYKRYYSLISNKSISTNSVAAPFMLLLANKFPLGFREQNNSWFSFIMEKSKFLRTEKLKKSRNKIAQAVKSGKRIDREFIWDIIQENFLFENSKKQLYKDVFTVPQNEKLEYLIRNSSDEEFIEFVNVLKKEVNSYVSDNLKNDIAMLTNARSDIENRLDYSFGKSKSELIEMLSDMSLYHENEVQKIFVDRPLDNLDEVSLLQYAEFLNVMDKKINDVVNLKSNKRLMNFYHWLGDYDNNKIKSYAFNIKKYNLDKRMLFDRGVVNYVYNSSEFSDFMKKEMQRNELMNSNIYEFYINQLGTIQRKSIFQNIINERIFAITGDKNINKHIKNSIVINADNGNDKNVYQNINKKNLSLIHNSRFLHSISHNNIDTNRKRINLSSNNIFNRQSVNELRKVQTISNTPITMLVMDDFPSYTKNRTHHYYNSDDITVYKTNISDNSAFVNQNIYELRNEIQDISSSLEHHLTRHTDESNHDSNTKISELVTKINEQSKAIEKLKIQAVQNAEKTDIIRKNFSKSSDVAVKEIGKQLYLDNLRKGIY